jgi:hypothetical protein
MINDDEIQKIIEQGGDSTDKDFDTYKLVFDGLKSNPENLYLDKGFSNKVMRRIQTQQESALGVKFWLAVGVFIFLISGIVAVALTPTGFKIFNSILDLKWYLAVFVLITALFQILEKRFHFDFKS